MTHLGKYLACRANIPVSVVTPHHNCLYAERMKRSEVTYPVPAFDVAAEVRAEMARARITSSDLSRDYGGAVSYWTRRVTGQQEFNHADLICIAELCGIHPAVLIGGRAPEGWVAPSANAAVTREYQRHLRVVPRSTNGPDEASQAI